MGVICTCGYEEFAFSVKLIATNRPNPKPWDAKYIPMLQIRCLHCDKFQKQAQQTPESIGQVNMQLEDMRFPLFPTADKTVIVLRKHIKRSLFD